MQARLLCFRALALIAVALLVQPAAVLAQNDDPETKEYNSYVLSLPKYKKYLAAMVSIAKASERPSVSAAFEGFGELSIDEAVARFNKVPEIRGAISRAGLKTREFVVLQGAFLSAGLAHAVMKQGALSPDSIIAMTHVSRANLEFYRKNEAEIARLTKEAEAKAPALKEAMGNGEDSGEGGEENGEDEPE